MASSSPSTAEKFVVDSLNKIKDPNDVMDAILRRRDIAQEYMDSLTAVQRQVIRVMAHQYFRWHPEYREQLKDDVGTATRILSSLKDVNSMVAQVLLEGPKASCLLSKGDYGSIKSGSLGLKMDPPASFSDPPATEFPEAGIEYLKWVIQQFRRLLYI